MKCLCPFFAFCLKHSPRFWEMEYFLPCQWTRMSQPTANAALQCKPVSPVGTQEGEEHLPSSSHQTAAIPHRGSSGCENRILATNNWGAYPRNDFSAPRPLHLPIHRKVLGSLTWDIWFSLIYGNLLTLDYLPSVAKLLYNLAPPLASLEQFSQGYLRCCLLGLSPKNFHWIKYNSTFILIFWGNQVLTVGERRCNY